MADVKGQAPRVAFAMALFFLTVGVTTGNVGIMGLALIISTVGLVSRNASSQAR